MVQDGIVALRYPYLASICAVGIKEATFKIVKMKTTR